MPIAKEILSSEWENTYTNEQQAQSIAALENGQVVFFPQLSFSLFPNEKQLLSPAFVDPKVKNISFNAHTQQLRVANCTPEQIELFTKMMSRYVQQTVNLLQHLFPKYISHLQLGRTSFRPVEIAGRVAPSYRKDDTRLHVDAFPATPNQGRRILRVFSNINPHGKERLWRVGEPFEQVAKRFLPQIRRPWPGRSTILKALKITRGYCTEYDYTMVQIHNKMKADMAYQKTATQCEVRFPADSTWIVQTDHVSHAAMAGQHVLEQTFYLPIKAMANPQLSPLRTLERLTGRALA